MSVNKVILIGNAGADPDLVQLESGTSRVRLRLATNERYTDRKGERQTSTQWHTLIFWGRSAEIISKYVHKGDRLYVEGRLQYRSWEDGEQKTHYVTEIVCENFQFLSPAGDAQREDSYPGGAPPEGERDMREGVPEFNGQPVDEDDFPF